MVDGNGKAITFLILREFFFKRSSFVMGSLLSKGATGWKLDHTPIPEGQEIFPQNV